MANIRVDLESPVYHGQNITFRSPADCSQVTGLITYYPNDSSTASTTFQFADAHGENVGGKNLFAGDVLVKVILDTELNRAYVQNADTNTYLEAELAKKYSASNKPTASDVGLGNVPNVTTNNQTPTYTAASTLAALTSGEKLSVAFGKIAKAVSDFISHLANKSNPHEVTASQAGAVPTTRKINGKPLSADISLTASDVSARPSTWTPSASDVGAAPTSHGNHVPATETANNAKFLRNDNTWATVTPANIGAAKSSHGNHVPTTETADNATFLRNDNTWQKVTPENIGAAKSSHGTHVSYGTSAKALGTSSAGSATTVSRSDHVHALPALTSCTGTLSVAKGGTGATDAATARTNLGITPANIGASETGHTHNYLPLTGGTLSGNATIQKSASPQLILNNTGTSRYACVIADSNSGATLDTHKDGSNYAQLKVKPETATLAESVQLLRNVGGTSNTYNLYGEHNKPTASDVGAAPSSHAHGNITSAGAIGTAANKAVYTGTSGKLTAGTLPVAGGGTGITSNPSMLTNLGSTSAASVFATSPRPGVTGTLPIANGGTGATTAAAALTKLGLTATATELNYMDGVTSNVQTQLDAKAKADRVCNPNLLDNWYWLDPVNSRGQTSYSGSYFIDRWRRSHLSDTSEIVDGGVKLCNNSSEYTYFRQYFNPLPAGTYTLSALITEGASTDGVIYVSNSNGNYLGGTLTISEGLITKTITVEDGEAVRVQGTLNASSAPVFAAFKLECGDTQTLAHQDASGNWVLNEVPNKALEAIKCNSSTADANDTYTNCPVPKYSYGTDDLIAGTSALETGKLYIVYE